MTYVFLALFFVFSAIHLKDSWRDDAKARAKTKPFLLLFIMLFYCFSTADISWVLMAALFTSWLGDVLLIPKGHKWFTIGGISFMLSHFLFMAVYIPAIDFSVIPWLLVVPVAAVYLGIALFVIRSVRATTPKAMVPALYIYLVINSAMNVFALMQLLTTRSLGGLVAYMGAILFFVSDCTLFFVRLYKDPYRIFKRHFTVMLTYLAGEFLITLGILLLQG